MSVGKACHAVAGTAVILLASLAVGAGPSNATPEPPPFYRSNYVEVKNVALWSKPTAFHTADGSMLGPFGPESVELKLADLPAHKFVRLRAKLVLVGKWEGPDATRGVSKVMITFDGSRTLLDAHFSSAGVTAGKPRRQSYPDNTWNWNNPPETGAAERNVRWAPQDGGNVVYDLDFTVPHTAGSVRFLFGANGGAPGENGWGFGEVRVDLFNESPVRLNGQALAALGNDLGNADPMVADKAVRTLMAAGDGAVAPLRLWLAQKAVADEERMPALLKQLDEPDFNQREAAQSALREMGRQAVPLLQEALRKDLTLEATARVQATIDGIQNGHGPPLWEFRLGRVADGIGSERARQIMENIGVTQELPTLEAIRKKFGTITDPEWNVLGAKIRVVLTAMEDAKVKNALGARQRKMESLPEGSALREGAADRAMTSDARLKELLMAVRKNMPRLEGAEFEQVIQARRNLAPLVTVRQEAILVSLGVLE